MKAFFEALKSDWSKRILFRYVSMYALAVGIVLLLLIPIRSEMYRMNYEAIMDESRKEIDAGLMMFDSTIDMMCTSADILTETAEYDMLRKYVGPGTAELTHSINEVRRELRNLIFMRAEYVDGAYLLFNQNELFISNFAAALSYRTIYPELFMYQDKTVEAWYGEKFANRNLISILPEGKIVSNEYYLGTLKCVTCIVQPWKEESYKAHSAISFMLDGDALVSSFATDEVFENGYVRIEDRWGNLIVQRGEERMTQKCEILSSDEHEYLVVHVGIPHELISGKIASITAVLKICIYLGLFGILILLGFVLAMHNFSAYRMLEISREYANVPYPAMMKMRSYDYVKECIRSITASRNAAERKTLLLQNNWNNEALLNACQRPFFTARERTHVLNLLGAVCERYIIVLFELAEETGKVDAIWMEEYMRAHLNSAAVSFYQDVHTAALIVAVEEEKGLDEICSGAKALAELCRTQSVCTPGIGISLIGSGVDGLNTAFEQARMAMRVHSMNAQQDYVIYDQNWGMEAEPCIGLDVLSKLTDLVVMGEIQEVEQLFNEIQTLSFEKAQSAPRYMYVFSAVRMALLNASRVIGWKENALPEFRADEPAQIALEKCRSCAVELCMQVRARRRSSNTVLKQSIGDYINAHFMDPNLSSEQIAKEFNLSRTYVLQFARMHFGKTLNEYIEDIRVSTIERYLTETDWTMEKIMEETGYISQNTMYRAFKRRHSVTPGRWRELFAKQEE